MAVAAVRWFESSFGVDICGDVEEREEAERRQRVSNRHVCGDGDADDVLAGDQILQFLERDLEAMRPTDEERAELEDLKRQYVNATNAIDFHNTQLWVLLDALWTARQHLTRERTSDAQLKVTNAKLDISERKDKRFFKQKEKDGLATTLRSRINSLQLRALADGRIAAQPPPAAPPSPRDSPTKRRASPPPGAPPEVVQGRYEGGGGMRRRRFVSDAEVMAALKHRDVLD
eukprot:Hpha_TRINITY_DN30044_c0_g1::TRINITY_DN30044_c0_g1_i1::g.21636::m.21636